MTAQRRITGNRLATRPKLLPTAKLPARSFPIQHSIQQLSDDLDALNERIAELEQEGCDASVEQMRWILHAR
jgi:hypothetical protein